jgi:hypothetical protein
MEIAFEIIKLAVVGLIAGLFSSALSNRDYRDRKWWELRVEAYQSSIIALSDLIHYYDIHYSAEIEFRELPDSTKERLRQYSNDAYPKIRRLADSGAFLFSDRANAALRKFLDQDFSDSYIDALDNNLVKSKACLSELIICSKEDLRLNSRWLIKWI